MREPMSASERDELEKAWAAIGTEDDLPSRIEGALPPIRHSFFFGCYHSTEDVRVAISALMTENDKLRAMGSAQQHGVAK